MPKKVAKPKAKAAMSKPKAAMAKAKAAMSKPKATNSKPKRTRPIPLSRALNRLDMKLTGHENETFRSRTIYAAGNSYVNCTFDSCTFVVTNSPFRLMGCNINNCSWRIEVDVLWGDPRGMANLRLLLQMIDGPRQANRQATAVGAKK